MAAAAARQRGAYCRQIVVRSESLTAKKSEAREHEKGGKHARERQRGTQREREKRSFMVCCKQAAQRPDGGSSLSACVSAGRFMLTEVPRNLREIPRPLYALNIGEQGPIRVLNAQIKAQDAQ